MREVPRSTHCRVRECGRVARSHSEWCETHHQIKNVPPSTKAEPVDLPWIAGNGCGRAKEFASGCRCSACSFAAELGVETLAQSHLDKLLKDGRKYVTRGERRR